MACPSHWVRRRYRGRRSSPLISLESWGQYSGSPPGQSTQTSSSLPVAAITKRTGLPHTGQGTGATFLCIVMPTLNQHGYPVDTEHENGR
jgi:hypothetical protein